MIPLTKWLKKAPPSLKRPNSQVCLTLFTFWGGVLLSSSFCGERRNPCSDSDLFLTRCRNLFLNAICAKAAGDEVFLIWFWRIYWLIISHSHRCLLTQFWLAILLWGTGHRSSAFLCQSTHKWLRWSYEPEPRKSLSFRNCWGMLAMEGFFRISFPKQKETLAKKVLGPSKWFRWRNG